MFLQLQLQLQLLLPLQLLLQLQLQLQLQLLLLLLLPLPLYLYLPLPLGTPRLQPWPSIAANRQGASAPGACLFPAQMPQYATVEETNFLSPQPTSSRPKRSAAERPLYFAVAFAIAVAVAVAVAFAVAVAVAVAFAVALASRYAKASALALYGQPKNRGFSPWGMPSFPQTQYVT
ncbi:MAG: hypothetical protein BGO25_05880 [Acidobacteriales bacterium 59-55]|nr:MAG: hypothetical protein BGO25_05880 [Acidobacteriales bacterium 59-55]